jgi:Asp-tRNA(Asn)/Glu-tRNA(Gln) amidotransferase A subunit family amidase
MSELAFAPITHISRLIAEQALDPTELTQLYLTRAKGVGRPLNAYVAFREKEAMAEAEAASLRARTGRRIGPLDGIPLALKDNIDIEGSPTGNGLGGTPPIASADANVTARLKRAGAIVLGKLNMHEAALGGTTDNPHHGRTYNPFRTGFSPGGSSGGSGAAVAAGLCAAALGTDTAGSVRLPASYCGIAGLKPSRFRISSGGVVPLHRGLDHVGPLARSIADISLLMAALTAPAPAWTPREAFKRLDHVTVCVLDNFARETVAADVAASFTAALHLLEGLGARIMHRTLADFDPAAARHALFLMIEAGVAAEHGDLFDRERERFSTGLARCLQHGRRMSAVQVLEAENRVRPAVEQMLGCFAEADVIASPTTPQAAFAFGQEALNNLNTFSTLANASGCPAVSLPMGAGPDGLPHGLQLMAPHGQDEHLLAIAAAFEAAIGPAPVPPHPFGPPSRISTA